MSDDLANQLRQRASKQIAATPVSLLEKAADRIEELEADLAKAMAAAIDAGASLAAAISLLDRGGKNAAPSNKMFAQMLADYSNALDRTRTTLAELKGKADE